MATKFKLDINKILLDPNLISPKEFQRLAQQELNNTKARLNSETTKGKKADGGSITPAYSESYKEAIAKGNAKSKTGVKKRQSSKVNFTVGGDLLRSRTVKPLPNGAEISFEGPHPSGKSNEQLAKYHLKGGGNLPARRGWHELGKKDIDRIVKNLTAMLDKRLKALKIKK